MPGQKVARVERHGLLIDYAIDDIAGAGAPFVGRIVQRSNRAGLDLVTTDGRRFQLQGPLARAHLAGPGYKVWIVGDAAGRLLRILRIGILATP